MRKADGATAGTNFVDGAKLAFKEINAVIRGDAKPLVNARDGLQNLRVTEAIAEAARTGKVISTERNEAP